MKTIERRRFLGKGISAVGLAALLPGGVNLESAAAKAISTLPDELARLLNELEATQARYYNVPRADGEFLQLLVKVARAKRVLGGLLVCHNAIKYKSAMQDYLDFIRQHEEFDTVIVSLTMDDGFVVSYRRRR